MLDKTTIKLVVLWGHKLHSHTHSYIHAGFFKAFEHIGYECLWLDNTDNISNIDFTNTLFITEGQVAKGIPIRDDCYYVLHNCPHNIFKNVKRNRKMNLQTYTKDAHKYNAKLIPNDISYYLEDCVLMPWATDLLPDEIELEIQNLSDDKKSNKVNFIGMMVNPWDEVKLLCEKNNLKFKNYGGFTNKKKSFEENKKLIQESFIAPSIQENWQVKNHYIPCRIFKNISYGKMGITNNEGVNLLFDNKLIYDSNIENLIKKGIEFENSPEKNKIIENLMIEVKNKHTFINRINSILWLFNNSVLNL